jgi:glycosyltransferase involved in cell wall biosynthesis
MKIAIIIPAYKGEYLSRTLESLAAQSCKDFHVFIGDDASPSRIQEIVSKFTHSIPLTYHRFEENLGGKDLTAQWQRCIDLAVGYDWIWLFSDDDIFSPDAIASAHQEILARPNYDIYRLGVDIIDSNENILYSNPQPQSVCAGTDFLLHKWQGKSSNFAVEFIFRSSYFKHIGGFSKFDLAWNSDDSTWFRMSRPNGIAGIPNGKIQWRSSNINISRDDSLQTTLRKLEANIDFISKTINQIPPIYTNAGFRCRISILTWFLTFLKAKSKSYPSLDSKSYILRATKIVGSHILYPLTLLYYISKRLP